MLTDDVFLWLLLLGAFVIPFMVRRVLLYKCQLRRWKANFAAICLLPSTVLAGTVIYSRTEDVWQSGGGMALIGLYFAVVISLAAAVVVVVIAEIIRDSGWRG